MEPAIGQELADFLEEVWSENHNFNQQTQLK
jgi:hypothetical protein